MQTILLLLAALATSGCRALGGDAGEVDHVVLMWLNDPDDEQVLEQLERTGRGFVGEIPGLLDVSVGRPVLGERPFRDDSYHIAFVMRFADRAALEAYDVHPAHVAAVTGILQPHVARLQIYDVLLR